VYGTIRRVLRDRCQSEEVAQEVLLEVWQAASRFDPGRGSALAWVMMIAHRRAVDRVRSEHRSADRDRRAAAHPVAYDDVTEQAEASLDRQRVRRCLGALTELQREAITPGLLRRLHLPSGRRPARRAARHGEHPDARRPDPAAGLPGSRPMRTRQPEPHTLSGAYALDALTGTDRTRFERHLARCPACEQEIRGLREATARLAAAAAADSPPG
jgi:RNA polymerase sigma factor (sigma-70 family)